MIDFTLLEKPELAALHDKVWEIVRYCGDIGWIARTGELSEIKDGEYIPFLIFESWEDVRHFYGAVLIEVPELGLLPDGEHPSIDFLEKLGIQWGFSDGYEECNECNMVIRTSPTHYGWRPEHWRSPDGSIICGACVRKYPDNYIDWLINDPQKINTILSKEELEGWGFRLCGSVYESGHHPGQTDNPKEIFETLQKTLTKACDIIFHWEDAGQFDLHFSVYIRDGEQ